MNWLNDLMTVLYPEILLLFALTIAILLSTSKFNNTIWIFTTIFLITGALHIIRNQFSISEPMSILGGMFIADRLSIIFRLITLVITTLVLLGSVKYLEGFIHRSEFIILLLTSVLGIMFLIGANDLVAIFIALETLGLSSILLVGYSKYDTRSNEASLKYLVNSASASAIFLFGLSILYGLTGSTQLPEIKYKLLQLSQDGVLSNPLIAVILILIICGLAFKLSSVPMHMWAPDVYEGAPTPVTAFLSVASKAAAFALTLRIMVSLFDFANNIWQPIIAVIAVLSMVIGNFVALGQIINKASIKRLMAYSSIAQIGYILTGIALFTNESLNAATFYLVIYSIMNIGAFLGIIAFGNETNSDSISDYSGLAQKKPFLAFALAVCFFNLAGLPLPPAGFIAKFILIKASFEAGLFGIMLGSIALITTILSIYYYSYIAKLMIVDKPSLSVQNINSNKSALGKSGELYAAITLTIIGIFLCTVFSNPILKITNSTITELFPGNNFISFK